MTETRKSRFLPESSPAPEDTTAELAATEPVTEPATEPAPEPAPEPDYEQETAVVEAFSFVPDPRPDALIAAANYYAGANVPDDLLIAKARKFERYLLEERGENWEPLSSREKKARKAGEVQA
jgi:hypothetical protein